MRCTFGAPNGTLFLVPAVLLAAGCLFPAPVAAQSGGAGGRSSAEFRGATKVLQILPIAGPLSRQDEVQEALNATTPTGNPPTVPSPTQDVVGERLPGLAIEQEWELPPSLDVEPETLPDSRETQVGGTPDYSVNWVGLNNRAKPRDRQVGEIGRVGRDRLPSSTLSHVVRRPSPPPPVINVFKPAVVHVPVHIQVVPMYVEHFHWGLPYPWASPYAPAYAPPMYFGQPSLVAPDPAPESPYGTLALPPTPPMPLSQDPTGSGIDPRYHVPTDQPMFRVREVNLVGPVSNSINFVSYPLNYHSYPAQRGYGVQVQTFPVTRLLP